VRISTTVRLTALAALLVFASNLAVIGYVRVQTRDDAVARLESEVAEQADALQLVYRSGGTPSLARAIAELTRSGDEDLVVALVDPAGRVRQGNVRGPIMLARAASFRIAPPAHGEAPSGFVVRRVGPDWLLSGRKADDSLLLQRALERALMIAGALSLLMGAIGGWIIAHFVGRRLRVIAGVVDTVAAGNLSHRATIVSGGDAFDALSGRVNMMLDRIEGLMRELQLLTNSLAHDLRSPLSRLRVKVERAVALDDGPPREAALSGLLQETDIIMRMLSTLLEIGRLEAMPGRSQLDWIEPAELVTDLCDMYEPVMEDARIAFDCVVEGPILPVRAHRELLSQALANLVDNAIRHGCPGEGPDAVTVRLSSESGDLVVAVEDRGPGIASDEEAEARRRFGRLDAARSRPGAGLGLALVEAVARLHGGRLELADNGPGLSARILLSADAGPRV
jgi:signal transduction histidine kinase